MSTLSAPLTCLAAGGLGITYAALQLRVGFHRLNTGITFGTTTEGKAEDEQLTAKMRAGANMQEYIPLGLLMMLLMETATPLPPKVVAVYGATFTAARLSVAYALANTYNPKVNPIPPRKYGFLTTIGCLVAAGTYLTVYGAKALRK